MVGRNSQNALPRHPRASKSRRRRAVISVITGLAFLGVLFVAVDRFPTTDLGRTIVMHLTQLADPESWAP